MITITKNTMVAVLLLNVIPHFNLSHILIELIWESKKAARSYLG